MAAIAALRPPTRKSREWRSTKQHRKMHNRQRGPISRAARPVRTESEQSAEPQPTLATGEAAQAAPVEAIRSLSLSTTGLTERARGDGLDRTDRDSLKAFYCRNLAGPNVGGRRGLVASRTGR